MEGRKKEEKIFQFCPTLGIPVYLRVKVENLSEPFKKALEEANFIEISELDDVKKGKRKVLEVETIGVSIGLRGGTLFNDLKSSSESVQSVKGHFIYRYYGHLAMLYSFHISNWRLGVINFKNTPTEVFKLALNRFLSLALSSFGVISFFGAVVNKKIVISNITEAKGVAVFVSVEEGQIIFGKDLIPVDDFFNFIKIDHLIKIERRMSKEELYAFLMARINYLHPFGPGEKIRNLVLSLSKSSLGIVGGVEKMVSVNSQELPPLL